MRLPAGMAPCLKVLDRVDRRIAGAKARFKELAESRTGDERVQEQLMELLVRWFVAGRAAAKPDAVAETVEADMEE